MLSEIERNPRLESRWLQPNPTYQNYVLPEISVGLEPVTPDIINHFLQCLELLDPSSPQSIELLNQILLGIIHHGIHFKSVIAPPHIYKMINCLKNESLRDATIQVILQLVFLLPKEVTNVLVQENILIFFKDILTAGCCCQTEEAILLIFNYVNIDNCDYLINISFFKFYHNTVLATEIISHPFVSKSSNHAKLQIILFIPLLIWFFKLFFPVT